MSCCRRQFSCRWAGEAPGPIETTADRAGDTGELAFLAPAGAAALRLLTDAVQRGTDHDIVVQALKDAGVHDAFADVLDATSAAVINGVDDPYDFDERLEADNLSDAASHVRRSTCRSPQSPRGAQWLHYPLMDRRYVMKVAIVTGAGSSIGQNAARLYRSQGGRGSNPDPRHQPARRPGHGRGD
ncbi:hypothetical protein ACFYXH_39050 [Streptomyces sp. NPDC002730]|uniref:hypothetical protein n=1 Tax=Streptomyces sp. NPDC002730 TaxID=3364662 RepID=UPI0036A31DDF